jgi:hypothetical protein
MDGECALHVGYLRQEYTLRITNTYCFLRRRFSVTLYTFYSPDLAPADYFLFRKVKSHLKGHLFDSISDIQKAVKSTLNIIAKDDFYKGIQKLHDRAYLCVQLDGMSKTKQ